MSSGVMARLPEPLTGFELRTTIELINSDTGRVVAKSDEILGGVEPDGSPEPGYVGDVEQAIYDLLEDE